MRCAPQVILGETRFFACPLGDFWERPNGAPQVDTKSQNEGQWSQGMMYQAMRRVPKPSRRNASIYTQGLISISLFFRQFCHFSAVMMSCGDLGSPRYAQMTSWPKYISEVHTSFPNISSARPSSHEADLMADLGPPQIMGPLGDPTTPKSRGV